MSSNLFVIDDWRRELAAEDHVQRQHLAKASLQRNFRGGAQRRVTSSSASSDMMVVDCCWARGHRSGGASPALSTYLFCALSGGALCIFNTTNFMKMYLFENDLSRRNRKEEHAQSKVISRQHDSQRERLAAIDSVLLPCRGKREPAVPGTVSGSTPEGEEFLSLVCATAEGWLCLFTVEPDAPSYTRSVSVKTGAVHKAVELPYDDAVSCKGTWEKSYIRFSPRGRRAVAVVSARVPCSKATTALNGCVLVGESVEYVTLFCVLKWQEGETPETYTVETSWTRVRAPSNSAWVGLKYVGWWDDEDSTLLTAWSDGTVSLLDIKLETVAHTSIFCTPAEEVAGRVSVVTAVAPSAQNKGSGRPPTSQQAGLVAMVLDGNIVMVFTVHDPRQHRATANRDGPPLKAARLETTRDRTEPGSEFTLRPGHHTYCSEDIPVVDLALFDNFIPYTLAVLLQSGALLALDTLTMELLYHRPLQRLFPPRGGKTAQQAGDKQQTAVVGDGRDSRSSNSSTTGRGAEGVNYFLRPKERPMAMCVVEHNTVVLLRPS
ncbi:hypothetical protein TRSC58_02865 [Trypanosoma rangeli SC58]|uniref:Uncharacterized protein n=1 Tax=Trypanosoma rangeli SC58 TaxID=429131 RepID=A0A061J7Y7_TRYRA|nr:hypothetical protein TRSC58_02865 [Trypanosoma rangeli SC58]